MLYCFLHYDVVGAVGSKRNGPAVEEQGRLRGKKQKNTARIMNRDPALRPFDADQYGRD
jgi:hypothetical protein